VDWRPTPRATFGLAAQIPVAAFDSIFPCDAPPNNRDCIPQPGTANKLDILSYRQRAMHRLAYRNYGTHESLVLNHSVDVDSSSAVRAGVRWYELRNPNGTPTVYQQSTFAPADGLNRWMGSIAQDQKGNLALGYSVSSSGVSPSIRYTGRLVTDALNTMQAETTLVSGSGAQTGTGARWGDYSHMSVDPTDDCTFWYTTEYIATTGTAPWITRIGSFKFANCP
jgi:hypothetical protein